jgi:hypothetical protein
LTFCIEDPKSSIESPPDSREWDRGANDPPAPHIHTSARFLSIVISKLHRHEARSNVVGMALWCRGTGMHRVDAREKVICQGGKDEGAKNSSVMFHLYDEYM